MAAGLRDGLRTALFFLMMAGGAGSVRGDIHFAEPVADVGEGRSGAPLGHRFAFVNRGREAAEIVAIRAGCGCLTPRLPKRVYQAGESGVLLLEINTLSQEEGPHVWTCQVTCQSGERRYDLPLQMKGRIVAEVTVRPAVLTVFTESAGSHELVLTDRRPRPLRVTDLRASSARLAPRIVDETRNGEGHTVRRLRLDVSADCPEGRHEESISIHTDDVTYRELRVPVTIVRRSRPRVSASPQEVTLPPGSPALSSHLIRLRDRQDQPVLVEAISVDDPAVTCTWAPGPETQATLRVRVDGARLASDRTLLRLQLSQPVQETVIIPIQRGTSGK